MNRKHRQRSLCSALAFASGIIALPGAEEAGAQALEEVIVTAQRREESLQDIPMSVTAFTGETLEVKLIDDISDLQFSVPNLLADGLNVAIRGVGNSAAASSAEDGLGYHINDVYVNNPLFDSSEYFDLERVEVLRGPQGTLYGRNTTAGVINIHTRKPHEELGGFFMGTLGNYDTQKLRGAINFPLGDGVRQRFAGFYQKRDGYTDNELTGRDIDGRDNYEIRSSTSIDFTERLSADLVISYAEEDSDRSFRTKGLCTKDATYGCSPLSRGNETTDVSRSIYQTLNAAIFGGGLFPFGDYFADANNPRDVRTVEMDQDPTYEREQLGVSLEFNYELENYRLTSLTGYYDTQGDIFWDADRFATDVRLTEPLTYRANGADFVTTDEIRSGRRERQDAEQFTQEFRIASDYSGRFNFLLGMFYFEEESSAQTIITHPSIAAAQQALGLDSSFEFFNGQTDPLKTESFAVFGEGYFDVTDKLRVTLGLRYTDDHKESRSRLLFLTLEDPAWIEAEDDWQELTGKLVAEYAITDDSMVFASFARGYKAGGLNPGGPSGGETFDPEYINAFEIGSKNTFYDGRLLANFGAFYYDHQDLQIGQINERTTTTENSDAEVMGVEGEFVFSPGDAWRFDLSVAWLDLELKDFESADESDPDGIAPGTVAALDENGNPRFTDRGLLIKNLDGNTLRNSPEFSANVGGQYTWDFDSGYALSGRVEYFWQDDYFANEFNKPSDKLDGWEQLNLQATLQSPEDNWLIRFYLKNALDNDDEIRLNQEGELIGRFRSVTVLEPRTYGVEFQMFFE
ncbi:MAG: TonB-dependent receptor [Pseudomonadota bacterium]